MSDIFVERQADGTYVAIQDSQVIAESNSQTETAKMARRKKPGNRVFIKRVRKTADDSRSRWRRF